MKITVVGIGYVGFSLSVLLSQKNDVKAVDILKYKVDYVNDEGSLRSDREVKKYLSDAHFTISATEDLLDAIADTQCVIVSTPTDYDEVSAKFDTSSVESVIDTVINNRPEAFIVIKSTIPVGFTKKMCERYDTDKILFSPEFLRESHSIEDNLYPSRIIVGYGRKTDDSERVAKVFAGLLSDCSLKSDVPVLLMDSLEAEAVKLFSNSYLAMRVAYFNEVDTYAELYGLNTANIIHGVSLDPRIGDFYNNPSFGYGGYCLPKDTKQLEANYVGVPENLISAIVAANATRKKHIANQINKKLSGNDTVGVYRLLMKSNSDNFRRAAIIDVAKLLYDAGVTLIVYEPLIEEDEVDIGDGIILKVEHFIDEFKKRSDIILSNRMDDELSDVSEKVYTRDAFSRD